MRALRFWTLTAAAAMAVSVSALPGHVSAQAGQAAAAAPQAAAPNPKLEQYKKDVGQEVDSQGEFIQKMNDQVFSFGELGFQEFETSKYLTGILKQNGFTVQENLAGIPTAWMASWGSGKPVIALGSDIDCIPQASQKPGVGYHDPIIEGAPGHGEGHNSGMPLQIAAALAVKKMMEREHLQGTLRLWPGVAEELLGAKAYYVRAGVFKDVDIALFAHVGSNMSVSWGDSSGNGLVSVEYNFKGESRARRRRAVARTLGARRGRTDGRRLELPPRAPAHPAALALRHHQRRRSARTSSRRPQAPGTSSAKPTTRTSRRCGRSETRWRRARP